MTLSDKAPSYLERCFWSMLCIQTIQVKVWNLSPLNHQKPDRLGLKFDTQTEGRVVDVWRKILIRCDFESL